MTLESSIEKAFENEIPLDWICSVTCYSSSEYDELKHFDGLTWPDIGISDIEGRESVWNLFPPRVFRYYLPALIKTTVLRNRGDLLAIDSIIQYLNRSPNPAHWNDHFKERWVGFSAEQYSVIADWILWLFTEYPDTSLFSNTFDRCVDTLTLLKQVPS